MNKKINILVYPCGSENAIEIHTALKDVVNIQLFGASGRSDHGEFVFKNYIANFPFINEDVFLTTLNNTVEEFKIDLIIPTHEDVVLKLASESNNINTKLAIPNLFSAKISRSKKMTFELFKNYSFCSQIFTDVDSIHDNLPIFVKPDKGQGGKGAFILDKNNFRNLSDLNLDDYVLCEYLPGEEITVDCFTDFHGQIRFIGPRKRERIFGGISVRSTTMPLSEEINYIADTINKETKQNGLWFFQLKRDKFGRFKLMEISVRTAGTMNLYRGMGVNFPLLTVYNALGYEIEIIKNDFTLLVDRALFNRYKAELKYNTVYIDFDDTITMSNGEINFEVISFLYQVKGRGKKIVLITKHSKNINDTLNQLYIHPYLFDSIIQLDESQKKYEYIDDTENSIFIDNAFQERSAVKKHRNIPVFDVDAISVLMDWRR